MTPAGIKLPKHSPAKSAEELKEPMETREVSRVVEVGNQYKL